MKRLLVLVGIVVILSGVMFTHSGVSAPPAGNKVLICHDGDDGGEVISVSKNAVEKHLEKHGDCRVVADLAVGEACVLTNDEGDDDLCDEE